MFLRRRADQDAYILLNRCMLGFLIIHCYIIYVRLRIFMQILISIKLIKQMEFKQKFISSMEYYNKYCIINTICNNRYVVIIVQIRLVTDMVYLISILLCIDYCNE